jgi:hypothetical protein
MFNKNLLGCNVVSVDPVDSGSVQIWDQPCSPDPGPGNSTVDSGETDEW